MATRSYSFTALFEPAEEGGYTVTVPALPGLVTEGDSLEEAREMARDAIRCYLESLEKEHQPLPTDVELRQEPIKETLTIAMPA